MHRVSPLLLAAMLLGAGEAVAAPNAGAKAHGEYNFYGHSVHASMRAAQAHTEHYRDYLVGVQSAAPATPVNQEIARDAGDAIGNSIDRMRRHLARMRTHARTIGDDKSLAMLDDVERQLTVAKQHHEALHAHHAADTIDPATALRHVEQVNAALEKARVEHDEVMQRLGDRDDP